MNDLNFEQSIERLEEIVSDLESGKMSLDDSLKLFEEGTSLIAKCNTALTNAEQKITLVTRTSDGDVLENEFE